jgi:hypothetical protein
VAEPEKFHHSVYVILLDDAVLKHRSILRLNPKRARQNRASMSA